ncbi:related to Adenosylmethionine-8-amino-7-oxononanoate aminotransferase [Melanopsichium pennsylvanicum]|uniref:Related to Adenosylmethionine-8-amino-7-oxononanoate aminotransferase n=2 Tax=Melanopsichium pennsylvanicum TaxID=63383 RepID=A0AAJ4XMJ4_9BASI|nr:related to Adenosylmethionine-8-amino-7-oxononanoate aminotransferase [Melanopsichium pennsylvanicum 4]SNX83783.1 related to Adenosylmethionine-8-amino-7-oxononanoate aminotransferase [Melanopsichium pennsylvanicum]
MAHLYPHLRVHQVFGANTDVGKTIFTTALCLASSALPLNNTQSVASDVFTASQAGLGERVHYLKPVSTGALADSDDAHISTYAPNTSYKTLYRFSEPVSPHLAVELERRAKLAEREVGGAPAPPSDQDFVRGIGEWIHNASQQVLHAASRPNGVAYVETAGGVHSPGPSGVSQTHLLRPLRLPTVLIGSAELGGISTTRSAFESLLMAGYDVEAVLLFPSPRYGNVEYLRKFFLEEYGIPVFGLGGPNSGADSGSSNIFGPPPTKNVDTAADRMAMSHFYQGLVSGNSEPTSTEENQGGVYEVVRYLREKHQRRIQDLQTMAQRTRDTVWWPFTQHHLTRTNQEVNVIDSAHGDFFAMLDQRSPSSSSCPGSEVGSKVEQVLKSNSLLQPVFDGSASWWTQCLGHAPQRLVTAAAAAAGRYGHVLFPNGTHSPALHLAELLTGKKPFSSSSSCSRFMRASTATPSLDSNPGYGWADRVFFSDDGSTGMEVALKMAVQASITRYSASKPSSAKAAEKAKPGQQPGHRSGRPKQEWEVLGLKGSYHGDTIGAMDACEPSVYSEAVHWYRGRGFWFDPPTVEIKSKANVVVSLQVSDEDMADRMRSKHLTPQLQKQGESLQDRGERIFSQSYSSMQQVYNVEQRIKDNDPLVNFYRSTIRDQLRQLTVEQGRKFGALVLEPLVMGAGGMIFVDPLYQRILVDTCRASSDLFSLTDAPLAPSPTTTTFKFLTPRVAAGGGGEGDWKGIPVIFDEVFAGLYRLGACTPSTIVGVNPDISVLAKILTGGMVPMSVTLASKSIFNVFNQSHSKVDALLHGHSYTAHPIGCAVALETLKAIEELKLSSDWKQCQSDWNQANHNDNKGKEEMKQGVWSFWSKSAVERLSELDNVDHAIAMGCVLKVALRDEQGQGGYTSTASVDILKKLRFGESQTQGHPTIPVNARNGKGEGEDNKLAYNVHARPLGNVIYLMSSLNSPSKVLRTSEELLYNAVKEATI